MAKQLARELDEAALYESDFYGWCMREARLLREGRLAELDLPNLAEEIESLGNEQEHALEASLRVLLVHLLKWRYQPKRRTRSWAGTIVRERGGGAGPAARHVPRDLPLHAGPGARPRLPARAHGWCGVTVTIDRPRPDDWPAW